MDEQEADLTGKYVLRDGKILMARRFCGGFLLTMQGTEDDAQPQSVGYRSPRWMRRAIEHGDIARASAS